MIAPECQWCIQIEVTNACPRACSNCTRMLAHVERPFFMSVGQFAAAVGALGGFPDESPPSEAAPFKLIGLIGGEPLLHPSFQVLLSILTEKVPNRRHRGLWTGLEWQCTQHADIIRDVFDEQFIHNNRHEGESRHSPVLVASRDAVADPVTRAELINDCWLQRKWSSSVTPKGFFFCEVAGAMDIVFDGPGGLPVESGCWERPIEDFREQIDLWCQRCGIPLNLKGRLDNEGVDDISHTNVTELILTRSPRIQAGEYVLYDPAEHTTDDEPWRYLK